MERLQKILAQAGVASRRKAEGLILGGRVKVNGQVVTLLGTKVDPSKDKVAVDGKPVTGPEKKAYILLNKPAGYVTTVKDPQGRPTVVKLLKGIKERVFPVGRLDYETEGLLLLTNDGDLAYALTHPKYGVEKVYLAQVVGVPGPDKLGKLRRGVSLEDGITAPAKVRRLAIIEGNAVLELKIHEGRNRQVRRMCESIGHPVMKLQRITLGSLTLESLPLGAYRHLKHQEVEELKRAARGVERPKPKRAKAENKRNPAENKRNSPVKR